MCGICRAVIPCGHVHRHHHRYRRAGGSCRRIAHDPLQLRGGQHRHRRIDILRRRLPDRDRGRAARAAAALFKVDVSNETLSKTTLGDWQPGQRINLERALKAGDELGGHIVAGHIDGVARILAIGPDGQSRRLTLEAPRDLARFIASKGSVALDGISLTVNEVEQNRFGINVIPHTLTHTTWSAKKPGDRVNLEVDVFARYVARAMELRT